MSTGARHKGDTVAAILSSPEEQEKIAHGRTPTRKGFKRSAMNLIHMNLLMKEQNRENKLRQGPASFLEEPVKSEYSQTAQETKMRKAEEKRARRAGK